MLESKLRGSKCEGDRHYWALSAAGDVHGLKGKKCLCGKKKYGEKNKKEI